MTDKPEPDFPSRPKPDRVRLHNGVGPEITVPPWWKQKTPPQPGQWLEWFLAQNTDAQLVIAAFHLDIEQKYARVREVVEG